MSSPSRAETSSPALAAADFSHGGKPAGGHSDGSSHGACKEVAGTMAHQVGKRPRPRPSSPTNSPRDDTVFHSATTARAIEEQQPAYEEAAADELLPPPDFRPFFTIVENPDSSEHHHPTVHYIFSDDDTEELTSATLAAFDQGLALETRPEVEERVVLLDMDASGKEVVTASSLSPRWQALKVEIGQAPSWGGVSYGGDGGLILKLSGKEITDTGRKQRKKTPSNVDDLVRYFGHGLDGLGEIMGLEEEVALPKEPSSTPDATQHLMP